MSYTLVDHTADLALRVSAPTLAGLLGEAAEALCDVMGARVPHIEETVRLECRGVDREDLLVRWLQEILYLVEVKGFRVHAARVLAVHDTALEGEIDGACSGGALKVEVKAVTYHALSIECKDGLFSVTIILDV